MSVIPLYLDLIKRNLTRIGFQDRFRLLSEVEIELGRPVRIGNDVNVAVDAEHRFGAGRGLSSFLGVFWGTGVGGGIVIDGRKLTGRGSAGEIGL